MRPFDSRRLSSMAASIMAAAIFFAAFLILNSSFLADSIKLKLVYRHIVIPIYQWALVSCYVIFYKYLTGERWRRIFVKGIILGMVFCLYLPMLDTQKQVWSGVPLSKIYLIYINIFVFLASLLLLQWGTILFSDTFFLPLFFLSIYGILFYSFSDHINEAILLLVTFVSFIFLFYRKSDLVASAVSLARKLFDRLSRARTLLFLIFVFALFIRLVFLFNLLSIEGARYPLASDDGDSYDLYGWKGTYDPMVFLRESPHYFWIFYSVFLTIVYKIFGHSYVAAGAIQSVIGALLCCMIFIFAYRITGNKPIAFLSSIGVALDSKLIHTSTTLSIEALYIPFLVMIILLLLFYKESPKGLSSFIFLAIAGFILGLATILRTIGIGLAALILPWILIWGRSYSTNRFGRRFRDSLVFLILVLLTISPITYTNYLNTKKFFLVYDTTSSVEWNAAYARSDGEDIVPSNKRLVDLGMRDPINDPMGSIKTIFKRPGDFIAAYCDIIPKRVRNLYLWPSFGYFDPIFLMNANKIPNRYAAHIEFYSVLSLVLGLLIFASSSIKSSFKVLSLIVVIYYTMFHGVFFLSIGPRYSTPMRPFLYIAISFGLYMIYRLLRRYMSYKETVA